MQVNWTDPAKDDLDDIFDFIAQDSVLYAESTVQKIIEVTKQLKNFPQIGRLVPKTKRYDVREVLYHNYRVVYWIVNNDQIDVLGVMHGKRSIQPSDLF